MPDAPAPPSLFALFWGFLSVGMFGFGGVLPWARRMVVEKRRWMTAAEFTDMLGLCQFLPGGNIMNVTVALGARFHGAAGAAAAFTGLMFGPVASVIGLGVLYDRYSALPGVRHAFAGLAAGAAALVLSNALKIAAPLRANPAGIGIASATFLMLAILRLPLALVLPAMVATGMLLLGERR
ncbi:MAG TPA: chromate transporter [Acetobacteraceae bacterium]|jgi:chromate transporter